MPQPSHLAVVGVPVTSVWRVPDAPRAVDRPIVGPNPSSAAWLTVLDAHAGDDEGGDGRLGLHDRIETQLVEGEPVQIVGWDATRAWAEVRCLWQPSPKSDGGYPGWVPAVHLRQVTSEGQLTPYPTPPLPADHVTTAEHATVGLARHHVGLAYLWGGLTPEGFDCSGLVHWVWRRLGRRVPRDAYAQAAQAHPVALPDVRSGDLYFFARSGRPVHHVGIVSGHGRMLHASESAGVVEEELRADRRRTLVAAGRLG